MKPAQKTNFSIIGLVVVTLLIVAFFVFPLLKKIQATSNEIKSQKEKYITLENQIKELEEFKMLYQDLAVFLEKIDQLFVDPEVPVDFIGFLEKKAAESYLTITISPSTPGKGAQDYWPSLGFHVSSKGYFPNFMKFLEKLESSPYLIEIRSLNVNQAAEADRINTNLIIKVYTK